MLEVSVIEYEHHTMVLRANRTKVATIARDRPPRLNDGGYLAAFWPQEARIEDLFVEPPPPIAAQAEPSEYPNDEKEVEEEDEPAAHDQAQVVDKATAALMAVCAARPGRRRQRSGGRPSPMAWRLLCPQSRELRKRP